MKIVYANIPMKTIGEKALHYPVEGNKSIEYDGKVMFPINAVLAKIIKKDERVKVVEFTTKDEKGCWEKNISAFEKELNTLNQDFGAELEFVPIVENFVEDKPTHEKRFKSLIDTVENGADIIADITYGPKTLPLILFSALAFSEKFFNANIQNIIYAKINYDINNNIIEGSQKIYDITSLYYLNSLTTAMDAPDGDTAKKMMDNFFKL